LYFPKCSEEFTEIEISVEMKLAVVSSPYKVLFAKYSGSEFKLDGTEYLLLESTDVLTKFSN